MNLLPHLAARLFDVPLAIHRPKLDLILAVLGQRIGLPERTAAPAFLPTPRPVVPGRPGIAVIPIHGTLVRRTLGLEAESGLMSYGTLGEQLDAALASPEVTAILLDVDSPGGESGGVFDLADRLRAATQVKPIWAVANEMAFSAAYALASAANRLFVSRTGGVGSIGVIALHLDQSVKDANEGLRYTALFAGAHKNDLSPHAPLSDAAQARLQAEVDRVQGLFLDTVARQRGLTPEAVRATEAGLFFGPDAVTAGLADGVGTLEEALAELTAFVSPTPKTSLASGSVPLRSLESAMTDHTDTPVAERLVAEPPEPMLSTRAAADTVAAEASSASTGTGFNPFGLTEALEIVQVCTLAGRAERILGFLEAHTPPAQVRAELLSMLALSSPEISSRIDPEAALAMSQGASPHNPLIRAVQRRLGSA